MQNSGRTSGSGCSNDNCVESCEQDWEKNGDHCYYWSTEKKNWTDSEDFCQKEGGHLASVTSKVLEGINRTEHLGGVWIGGNDLEVDGVWRWTDCSPWEFTIWGPGEPNNWGGVDDCLHHHIMDWGHKWNDGLCGFESKFLCSKSICSGGSTVSGITGGSTVSGSTGVCSGPFGFSAGGTAFSDEDIAGGRHITAIKIRVGIEMNSIQAYYDGQPGPSHGYGTAGDEILFEVPTGSVIVSASGTTMPQNKNFMESIQFVTSDGQVHGPFGNTGGTPWTADEGEGCTLDFLKGRSGSLVDQLSLCWRQCNALQGPVVELEPVSATQSSTFVESNGASHGAGNCIDGETVPVATLPQGGICHTLEEAAPWIAIDYG